MESRFILGTLGAIAIACAFVYGLVVTNNVNESSTPLITTVLGLVSLFVYTMVSGGRVEKKVDRVLNGEMEDKIARALHAVLDQRAEAQTVTETLPENPSANPRSD